MSRPTKGLVDRARWLAAGQDDPHSTTITELCDAVERLEKGMIARAERIAELESIVDELERGPPS